MRLPRSLALMSTKVLQKLGLATLAYWSFVKAGCPLTVKSGPFANLNYVGEALGSALYPKIFGSYELELQELIESLCKQPFDTLIDIGSAEGYYAVGMATRMPHIKVYGFDIDPRAGALLEKLARKNKVLGQITAIPPARCVCGELEALLKNSQKPLIICDCEGCEEEWLDPKRIPELRRASILVELHDCFLPGLSKTIFERFEQSHTIVEFSARSRVLNDFKADGLPSLTNEERLALMDEGRDPSQSWYCMAPK
jgi:hypothetical protein